MEAQVKDPCPMCGQSKSRHVNASGGPCPPKPDAVNHPQHYNSHPAGIECIDVVEHMPFNVGSAMKYLWRAGLKTNEPLEQDMRKAIWYVEREVKRRAKMAIHNAEKGA